MGVATHDDWCIDAAERLIRDLAVPEDRYEFQMLLGVDEELRGLIRAAGHRLRELIAGGSGAKLSAARFAPRLADLYMERWTFDSQKTGKPANGRPDNLYQPVRDDGGERGRNWEGHVRRSSVYTRAVLHPAATAAVAAGLALGVGVAARARDRLAHDRQPVRERTCCAAAPRRPMHDAQDPGRWRRPHHR